MTTNLVSLQSCCDTGTSVFAATILSYLVIYLRIRKNRQLAGLGSGIAIFIIGWLSNWLIAAIAAMVATVLVFKGYHLAKGEP